MSILDGMTKEEVIKLSRDRNKSRILSDALLMEMWLEVRKEIEQDNLKEVLLKVTEMLQALMFSVCDDDETTLIAGFDAIKWDALSRFHKMMNDPMYKELMNDRS